MTDKRIYFIQGKHMECPGCGRQVFYDLGDHSYHHINHPGNGCSEIPPEDQYYGKREEEDAGVRIRN